MRRAVVLTAAAWAALAAPGALAQAATAVQSLPVTGQTPQVCTLQQGDLRTGELINFRGADGDTLRVLQLIDPRTLAAQSARASVFLSAVCNFPHRIRIESQDNGLWPIEGPVSPDKADFATALPYQVSFEWADHSGSLQADAKVRRAREARADIDAPAAGDLRIDIALDAGASNTQLGAPVLAGNYADTLRIFLEPR
jgi:hypothetical protein